MVYCGRGERRVVEEGDGGEKWQRSRNGSEGLYDVSEGAHNTADP